jgi:hypothetical protein
MAEIDGILSLQTKTYLSNFETVFTNIIKQFHYDKSSY